MSAPSRLFTNALGNFPSRAPQHDDSVPYLRALPDDLPDRMAKALWEAAGWFRDYEESHYAKGTPEGDKKARRNGGRARPLEALATEYDALREKGDG